MKIALASDIHLEFGPIELTNDENADVLILSGDICVARDLLNHDPHGLIPDTKSVRYHTFFQECSARFPMVLYVAGNHEHYHGDFRTTIAKLRDRLSYLKNVVVMDKTSLAFYDVLFYGGTLWTDMNKEDPITLSHIVGVMNDYKQVVDSSKMVQYKVYETKNKPVGMTDDEWMALPYEERHTWSYNERPGYFSPEVSVQDHKDFLAGLKETLTTYHAGLFSKVVVIGHHAPTKMSTKPRYEGEHIINGAYSSDLSEFILDHPQIKMWTHGHTHHPFDYMVGQCRVACNPRGYHLYEDIADHFKLAYFDV